MSHPAVQPPRSFAGPPTRDAVALGAITLALGIGVACTCPGATCGGTLDVIVRDDAWPAGRWTLQIAETTCAFELVGGEAPLPIDVTCDSAVSRASYVIDTGGTQDPTRLELTFPFPDPPSEVAVTWTWSGSATPWTSTEAVPWRDVSSRAGSCETGCKAARIEIEVPGS